MTEAIKHTVAVVDDDYRVLESLESLLESAGYIVRLFSSAEAFISANALSQVDCLISDISMPGIDGFRLLKVAQLDRPQLPVILITGREELMSARAPVNLPSEHFFIKPFDGKKLLAAVTVALRRNQ